MFDIGFSELMLVFVIGLAVLGPERLPIAVRTIAGWIKAIRSIASTVQNELIQELNLQELQDSLKKVEEASKNNLSPKLKASMEELREAAKSMKKEFKDINPMMTDPEALHDSVTPAEGDRQDDTPPMTAADSVADPTAQAAMLATKALLQEEPPGGASSAPRPESPTYTPLNNNR